MDFSDVMGNNILTVVPEDSVNIVHWEKLQVLLTLMDVISALPSFTAPLVTVPPLAALVVITALIIAPLQLSALFAHQVLLDFSFSALYSL